MEIKIYEDVFSEILNELRKDKGVTQDEMAKILNMKKEAYAHYEQGRSKPSYNKLLEIADCFYVSLDFLTGKYGIE